ncbi:MAG: sigma-70 family RNA polymerase sigma factor [Oscillospiraceae bacterium]|nr:sigma-70 family RNA polymerase sigma factor [Oscillospiraceae bacterium]
MEDQEIVELYWQRSDRAIAETAAKYGPYCRSIALRLLGSDEDTEECLDDVWLRAWNSMPDDRPDLLRVYLARLTRWQALTRLRGRTRQKRAANAYTAALDELAEILPGGTEPAAELEHKELTAALDRFLAALPETERTVFLARYWFGYGVAEIAAAHGFGQSKVKSMLLRTRRRLWEQLRKEEYL